MGLPQGKQIGQVLDKLFAKVVEDPACNTKEILYLQRQEKRVGTAGIDRYNLKDSFIR